MSAALQTCAGAALLAGTAVADRVGAGLLAVAGLVALVVGVRDLVLRPVVHADGTGLTVVDGWRRFQAAWADGVLLEVVRDRRTPLLSVDTGDHLVVLSRRRLGTDPTTALAALDALRHR